MGLQFVFKRVEQKYILNQLQYERLQALMAGFMCADAYGKSTIRNMYLDRADSYLIRQSLSHPAYKEKVRLRAYKQLNPGDKIFFELKKKFGKTVYKRRLQLGQQEALDSLIGLYDLGESQIARELAYVIERYAPLQPAVMLFYEREAYFGRGNPDFRLTIDHGIRWRDFDFSFAADTQGELLLDEDHYLMEVKLTGGIPFWLLQFLSAEKLFPTGFSKYGLAYLEQLKREFEQKKIYALEQELPHFEYAAPRQLQLV